MPLNSAQLKYARERAKAAYDKRVAAIKTKHTTPAVRLDRDEKVEALKKGRFKVEATRPYSWYDAVIFTDERPEKADAVAIATETNVLSAAYQQLLDDLILGDNVAALEALKAFEAGDAN